MDVDRDPPALPGDFRSSPKLWHLSRHVDFPFPDPSYCDNPPSGLFCFVDVTINHRSPATLFLHAGDTYL